MKAFIGQYYKTADKAAERAEELKELWKGKIAFYVLCAKNGYFVISESVARKLCPNENFSYKNRRYKK